MAPPMSQAPKSRPSSSKTTRKQPTRFEAFGQQYVVRQSGKRRQRANAAMAPSTRQKPKQQDVFQQLRVLCGDMCIPAAQQEALANHYGSDEAGAMQQLDCLLNHRSLTIAALRFINVRERAVGIVGNCAAAYETVPEPSPGAREHIQEYQAAIDARFLQCLADARDASFEVVQAISKWAMNLPPGIESTFLWKNVDYPFKMRSDISDLIDAQDGCLGALRRLGLDLGDLTLLYFKSNADSGSDTGNGTTGPTHTYWRWRDGVDSTPLEHNEFQEYILALRRAATILRGLTPSWGATCYPQTPSPEKPFEISTSPAERRSVGVKNSAMERGSPQELEQHHQHQHQQQGHPSLEQSLASGNPLTEWHHHTTMLLAMHGVPQDRSETMASRIVRNLVCELDSLRGRDTSDGAWWTTAVADDLQQRLKTQWLTRFVTALSGLSNRRRIATAWRAWVQVDRAMCAAMNTRTKNAAEDLQRRLNNESLARFANVLYRMAHGRRISAAWRAWVQADRLSWEASNAALVGDAQRKIRVDWLSRIVNALSRIARCRRVAAAWRTWIWADRQLWAAALVSARVAEIVAEKEAEIGAEHAKKLAALQEEHRIEVQALTDSLQAANKRSEEMAEEKRWHDELQEELAGHINDIETKFDDRSEMYIRATLRTLLARVLGRLKEAWGKWTSAIASMRHAEVLEAQRWSEEIQQEMAEEHKANVKRTAARALVRITKGNLAFAFLKWKAAAEAMAMGVAENDLIERHGAHVSRLKEDYNASVAFLQQRVAEGEAKARQAPQNDMEPPRSRSGSLDGSKAAALRALQEEGTQAELRGLYESVAAPRQKSALRRVFRAIGGKNAPVDPGGPSPLPSANPSPAGTPRNQIVVDEADDSVTAASTSSEEEEEEEEEGEGG